MTFDETHPYRGRRRSNSPAFPVPSGPGGGVVALAGPDGPAPRPVPPVDPDDKLVPYERAVDLIKNVIVIVTCTVVLYAIWSVYNALAEVSQRLEQLPL